MEEVLIGSRRYLTPYEIYFKQEIVNKELCSKKLDKSKAWEFSEAVHNEYYIEFLMDELPFWTHIGEIKNEDIVFGHLKESRHFLFTHIDFDIGYNNDQIIYINATTPEDKYVDVSDETVFKMKDDDKMTVDFTYSVRWHTCNTPYEKREDVYFSVYLIFIIQRSFLPKSQEIHWVFIINSAILVIILILYVLYVLANSLRKDFAVSAALLDDSNEEQGNGIKEDIKWKLIHADVFRSPSKLSLLCAIIGNGCQLIVTAVIVVLYCQIVEYGLSGKGHIVFTIIIVYCLTTFINGYVCAYCYKYLGGKMWSTNILLSDALFLIPFIIVFSIMNSVAVSNGSTAALPFTTILAISSIYLFIAFPLSILGGTIGHNRAQQFNPPVRVGKEERPIPECPWYHKFMSHFLIGGLLPFSSIYVEMFYIFGSMWGNMYYTYYGLLTVALFLLVLVTFLLTIGITYFTLTCENWKWWWKSILCGGSAGLFLFGYSVVYFYVSTHMDGFMQAVFFFGYMGIISYGLFLILGSIGFIGSFSFVRYLYGSLKFD